MSGDRQKRKQRQAVRPAQSRSEAKDQAAREALEPLPEGERPGAVTVGAVVATLIAIVFWVSAAIAIATDIEVEGSPPQPFPLILFAVLLTVMAYGMWRARYWAVLGFQALLALVLLSAGLGLVQVTTLLQAAGTLAVLAGAGALFYFMVKAMARIQMPERQPRR